MMNVKRLLLCSAILWVGLVSASYAENHRQHSPTLTVVGTGTAAGSPDTVSFQAGVNTSKPSATEALDANNQIVGQIRAVLTSHGVAAEKIQTSRFDVGPEYKRSTDNQQPQLTGYRVSHVLSVSSTDLEQVGTLLDALIKAGSNVLHGIRFTVGDPAPLLDRARDLAVADAQHRAENLAAAAGLTLGPVKRISEGTRGMPMPMHGRAMEMSAAAAVPVATGEDSYSVSVTIVYEMQ